MTFVFLMSLRLGIVRVQLALATLEPAHVRQGPLGMAADGDQLGRDGDRDFFRSDRSDVEADGCVNAVEQIRRQRLLSSVRGKW